MGGFIKNAAWRRLYRNGLFKILFRCIDRGNQSYSDFPTEIFQSVILCKRNNICLTQQQKPIACFIGFFQGNLQF